jgi:hypothetical protein
LSGGLADFDDNIAVLIEQGGVIKVPDAAAFKKIRVIKFLTFCV